MDEDNEIGSPNARKVTKAHFQALLDVQFRNYLLDAQSNPVLRLIKEMKELQRQANEVALDCANSSKTIDIILKAQDTFLQKIGMRPRQFTRTVGVNVNITSKDERNQSSSADVKPNVSKLAVQPTEMSVSPAQNSILKSIKSEPGVATAVVVSQANSKSTAQKRSSVDIVDLTMEEEKQRPKLMKTDVLVNSTQNYSKHSMQETQATGSQFVQRENVNFTTLPLMTSLSPMIQIGSPPVQFPESGTYSTSLITPNRNIPPGLALPSRIAYVLPNTPLGVMPRNIKPNEVPARLPVGNIQHPGTIYLTSRPASHIFSGRSTLEAHPELTKKVSKHPAPLPEPETEQKRETVYPQDPPPKPSLKISKPANGIVLSWSMTLTSSHAKIKSYQLYGYEENPNGPVDSSLWKKVGEVNALPLPMACTLTQFADGRKYYFAIRAVDVVKRIGPFSEIASITLSQNTLGARK